MPQRAFQRQGDAYVARSAVLYGYCVDRTRYVSVTPIRREDGASDYKIVERACKSGKPVERALPRQTFPSELLPHTSDAKNRAKERSAFSVQKVLGTRDLDRGSGSATDNAYGVEGAIGRMNAREGKPMVTGNLPGNCGRRDGLHGSKLVS